MTRADQKPAAAGKMPHTEGKRVMPHPAGTDKEALESEEDSSHESEDDEDDSDIESYESGDSAGDDPENPDVITEDFLKRNPLSR